MILGVTLGVLSIVFIIHLSLRHFAKHPEQLEHKETETVDDDTDFPFTPHYN
jgi:hypothetical protein